MLQPPVVDLALYAGDGASIRLVCDNVMGAVVPLDGAVTAQVRTVPGDSTVLQSFSVDLTEAASGVVVLGLSGGQTASLAGGEGDFGGVWDVEYTATGAEPLTLVRGKVHVRKDVTRP
jgi:hypothetical protein